MLRGAAVRAAGAAVLMIGGGMAAHSADMPLQCRHVQVLDDAGHGLSGIEDMAIDAAGQRLILSAYDRQQVDRDIAAGRAPEPGGLYFLGLAQFEGLADGPLTAIQAPVAGADGVALFPHGIGLRDSGGQYRLAVVNRHPGSEPASGAELLILEMVGDGFRLLARHTGDAFCRANDVVLLDDMAALFTFDQRECGGWPLWLERALSPGKSGIRQVNPGSGEVITLVDDMAFANGIVFDETTSTVVAAASRAGEIRQYPRGSLGSADARPQILAIVDGGPDNLSIAPDGRIIVAVHPDPFALFLHMNEWGALPQSRVMSVDGSGHVSLLAEGGSGTLPGAATSAVIVGQALVVSSAWDHGLGVCTPDERAAP